MLEKSAFLVENGDFFLLRIPVQYRFFKKAWQNKAARFVITHRCQKPSTKLGENPFIFTQGPETKIRMDDKRASIVWRGIKHAYFLLSGFTEV